MSNTNPEAYYCDFPSGTFADARLNGFWVWTREGNYIATSADGVVSVLRRFGRGFRLTHGGIVVDRKLRRHIRSMPTMFAE